MSTSLERSRSDRHPEPVVHEAAAIIEEALWKRTAYRDSLLDAADGVESQPGSVTYKKLVRTINEVGCDAQHLIQNEQQGIIIEVNQIGLDTIRQIKLEERQARIEKAAKFSLVCIIGVIASSVTASWLNKRSNGRRGYN